MNPTKVTILGCVQAALLLPLWLLEAITGYNIGVWLARRAVSIAHGVLVFLTTSELPSVLKELEDGDGQSSALQEQLLALSRLSADLCRKRSPVVDQADCSSTSKDTARSPLYSNCSIDFVHPCTGDCFGDRPSPFATATPLKHVPSTLSSSSSTLDCLESCGDSGSVVSQPLTPKISHESRLSPCHPVSSSSETPVVERPSVSCGVQTEDDMSHVSSSGSGSDSINREVELLKAVIELDEMQMTCMKQSNDELAAVVSRRNTQLQLMTTLLHHFALKSSLVTCMVDSFTSLCGHLMALVIMLVGSKDKLEAKVQRMKSELFTRGMKLQETERALLEKDVDIAVKDAQIAELSEQYTTLQNQHSLQQLLSSVNDLQQQQLQQQVADLAQQNVTLLLQNADLEQNLNECGQTMLQASLCIISLQGEMAASQAQVESTAQELEDLAQISPMAAINMFMRWRQQSRSRMIDC